MTRLRAMRTAFVDGPLSLGARARSRRWKTVLQFFPMIEEMSVLDLGGTVEYWLRAPVRPRSVHLVNLEKPPVEPPPDWIRIDVADACKPPSGVLDSGYDLVYSNSVIEHVGGHDRRMAFAETVRRAAPEHWVQTPYRYFPVEPHWVCPFMQYLPLWMRARLGLHWPLVHTPHADLDGSITAQLQVELLDITQMRHYFPSSDLVFDRMLGLVKSVVAVQRVDH
jgi:hypothetical protein